jgi:predicted NAD-dependent protein-ADP-ribosyltransferase YbiA (DUF1768 family)
MKDGWETSKFDVMLDLLKQKFTNKELGEKLLATEDAILVEGTYWHDNCWGVCSCRECSGVGTNMLGTLLMQVRNSLFYQAFITILPETINKENPYERGNA